MAEKADKKEKKPAEKPAKKKKRAARKGPSQFWRNVRQLTGILLALVALYTLATLVSYIFTWSKDQSLLSNPELFSPGQKAFNIGGKLGFLWANLLVARLFGFGAFTLPLFLGALSAFFLRIKKVNLVRVFAICFLGAIIFSVLFAYIFSFFDSNLLGGAPGGSYGFYANQWLCNLLGKLGGGSVVFVLVVAWAMLLSNKVSFWFDQFIYFTTHRPEKPVEPEPAEEVETEEEPEEEEMEEDLEQFDDEPNPEVLPVHDTQDNIPEDFYEPEPVPEPAFEPAPAPEPAPVAASAEEVPLDVEESENDFLANLTEDEKAHLFDPRLDLPNYEMPSLSMLNDYLDKWYDVPLSELEKNKQRIVNALANYKIGVASITASKSPTVTLYKIHLAEGIKVAQVRSLEEDIAISLGTNGVRVVKLTDAVGIEVPNERASVVPLKSVLNSPQFKEAKMELPMALGITVTNEPFFLDLAKMPHLLVAGATGQGKSVGLNCIIASLLFCKHPAEIKFVMVDPKRVEFSLYSKLENHYLAKLEGEEESIITDTKKVITTLVSLCEEMEARYELMKKADVRQIKEYNALFLNRKLNPNNGHQFMPYIVVVIDEFADLITTAGREIEEPIARLAQKARAVGIHLVLATQRPTTNIITGNIKANFNSRIAFRVNSSVDSKTIIDATGANRLIGRGDMLVIAPNMDLTRVQCALIDTDEVKNLVSFIHDQHGYPQAFTLPEPEDENADSGGGEVDLRRRDKFFEEAARIVVDTQQGSVSLLQRKLDIGYPRAGKIIEQLEAAGIVGPFEGSKARTVLISDRDSLARKLESLDHQTIV